MGAVTVLIRRATAQDAAQIARVHVSSWQTSYAHLLPAEFLNTLEVGAREARWNAIFERGESLTFVAVLEGKVVGFVSGGAMLSSIEDFKAFCRSIELFLLNTSERSEWQR